MARPSLIWPLTLLVAFAVFVGMLILGALPALINAQGSTCNYPVGDPRLARCIGTATARAQTQTAQVYPSNTATNQSSAPPPAPAETGTTTPTTGVSPTVTAGSGATPTVAATSAPTATRAPQGSPLPTPTSTLVGLETLICAPGGNVAITGRGEPGRALLVYFNERPVGGSLVRPDGHYTLLLRVGAERPGIYLVEIRDRDTRLPVRSLACEVPGATATPTEVLVP
jgi:hypothetical protein